MLKKEDCVAVLLPHPFDKSRLDYLIPFNGLRIGDFVEVPLGSRRSVGVIWEKRRSNLDSKKLKYIFRSIEGQSISSEFRKFLIEFSRYNLTPLGKALRLVISGQDLLSPKNYKKVYQLSLIHI